MQNSKDIISQKSKLIQNSSLQVSQEQSQMLHLLDSFASRRSISRNSMTYRSLSIIFQSVDSKIRIEKYLYQLQNSHILDSLSVSEDNKQSSPANVPQNSLRSQDQSSMSEYTKFLEECQQVMAIFANQFDEQERLERQNKIMNLLIRFQNDKSPKLSSYTEEELKIIHRHYQSKRIKYQNIYQKTIKRQGNAEKMLENK